MAKFGYFRASMIRNGFIGTRTNVFFGFVLCGIDRLI